MTYSLLGGTRSTILLSDNVNELMVLSVKFIIWLAISAIDGAAIPTSTSWYCRSFVLRSSHRELFSPTADFILLSSLSFGEVYGLPLFLCAASLLANGRCSPRATVHDHHPLTLIRQRSHHVVACPFEVSVSVTRDEGRRAAGCL